MNLIRQLVFEPVTKESPIVNEKEAKLVENLYGQTDESISFEQYGITMEHDRFN